MDTHVRLRDAANESLESGDVVRSHDGSGPLLYWFEAACVLGAAALVVAHVVRFCTAERATGWTSALIVLGAWVAADFATGLVHWSADTWGAEETPFWGPRFLRPFRVHHVTPRSFLECGFFDTNGDTALLCLPGLIAAFFIPLSSPIVSNAALFLVAFCAIAAPTNQIHQWAHREREDIPWPVRLLQRSRLILSPREHARHHRHPHVTRYCISSGVCNEVLDAIEFFPRMEKVITALTGAVPRRDEQKYLAEFEGRRSSSSNSVNGHSEKREAVGYDG